MSHEDLEPKDAHERLSSTDGALYLDVRSVAEFEQGHPEGAWNLPLLHFTEMGMQPNQDFLAVAEAVLPKDRLLVVGCKAGGRSAQACGLLAQAGFSMLVNVAGGYHGAQDRMTGQIVVQGWEACDLPTSTTPAAGATWDELKGKRD
jgi:rhodanese-related sulfurtransferase